MHLIAAYYISIVEAFTRYTFRLAIVFVYEYNILTKVQIYHIFTMFSSREPGNLANFSDYEYK